MTDDTPQTIIESILPDDVDKKIEEEGDENHHREELVRLRDALKEAETQNVLLNTEYGRLLREKEVMCIYNYIYCKYVRFIYKLCTCMYVHNYMYDTYYFCMCIRTCICTCI